MNLNQIITDLEKILDDKELFAEIGCDPAENKIFFEIQWGDWKHDHAYLDYLVTNYLILKGIGYVASEVVDEEDGSDCYSATHYFRLKEVS